MDGKPPSGVFQLTVKEYLRRFKHLADIIRMKSERFKCMESAVVYTTPQMSDMPRMGSDPAKRRTDALVELVALQDEIADAVRDSVKTSREVMRMLDTIVNDDVRWLMYARYVEALSWKEISSKMGRSERQVFRMHGEGLRELSHRFHNVQD